MFAHFKTLPQLFDYFKDEQTCLEYWENVRWNGNVTCPHCGTEKPYKLKKGYKCKAIGCQKKFSAIVGSIFESSKMPLRIWFGAIYLCMNHKKGISSLQLSRDLGIHQKSAWFLLHRIRETVNDKDETPLGGEGVVVETDTTVVGGKVKNMNNKKRQEIKENKRGVNDNKTIVVGYIERANKLRFKVLSPKGEKEMLKDNVEEGSVLMTDSATTYTTVGKNYAHHGVVDHSKSEYVKDEVVHTNTLEGGFSLLDRMIIGTYHSVSPKHLQAYCNEQAFRYNTRKAELPVRFEDVVRNCSGIRLKYNTLIGK